nr:MAG TPA: hypothetical protein [Caudoviricetes sp.]
MNITRNTRKSLWFRVYLSILNSIKIRVVFTELFFEV